MQFFLWLAFLVLVGVAIFTIQNSTAPAVVMKFLFWNFETSLIYTILISVGSGMLTILFLWIPRSIKASFREKNLRKEIEILER
ncbi:MAG TPA: LapA family protein [Thermodesulfobacteriota bacterium]|nr:LapA family protein [Thermodesulfobacteriota bacterium]